MSKEIKLSRAQQRAIALMQKHTLLFYTGPDYTIEGNIVGSHTVAKLEAMGLIEKPQFSSVYSLTTLGKSL